MNDAARRLWRLWRDGLRPALADFLAGAGPLSPLDLASAVRVDQRERWLVGQRPLAEEYLASHPALAADPEAGVDVVYSEFLLRRELGELAEPAEYLRRFPQYADMLRIQFELGLALADSPTRRLAPANPSPPTLGGEALLPEEFGRYRILRKLGGGGMGLVYLAHDTELNRQVALKVPRFADGEGVLERFRREARAAAALHHPNLCPVFDVGQHGGVHFLTMAYLQGRTLAEALRDGPRFSPEAAAALLRQVALALAYAHGRGVVHRDLKPSNIMLTTAGEPVVMDFGLARPLEDPRLTRSGQVMGTPAYMAPEQARGGVEAAGPPADIWSLGVILHEMLTGRLPPQSEAPLPSALCLGLAPHLESACLKALAPPPEARFPTMEAFAEALAPSGAAPRAAFGAALRLVLAAVGFAAAVLVVVLVARQVGWPAGPSDHKEGPAPEARDGKAPAPPDKPPPRPFRLKQARRFEGHASPVTGVAFAAGGKHAVSTSTGERQVRRWELATAKEVGPGWVWKEDHFGGFALSPSGDQLLLSDFERVIPASTLTGKHSPAEVMFGGPGSKPGPMAFSRDGRHVIAAMLGNDGTFNSRAWVSVLDLETRKFTSFRGHKDDLQMPSAVALSSDGSVAASASNDGLFVWSVAAPDRGAVHIDHVAVNSLAFSPKGDVLLAGEQGAALILWACQSGQLVRRFTGCTGPLTCIAFSPDGQRALSGEEGGVARLWDVRTGEELAWLEGHRGAVTCLTFSADGKHALTGGADRAVRLWGLASVR